MIDAYIIPVALLLIAGVLVTAILFIAAKYMAVPVDEKAAEVREALPGANCGACGYAGCDAYSEAVAKGEAACNLCIPAGPEGCAKIAAIMGQNFEAEEPKKAFVKCNGTCENTQPIVDYDGPKSCQACAMIYGGNGTCTYGCLGFGDCVTACAFDSIHIIDGIAKVDKSTCTGCEMCVYACPKNIIEMIPEKNRVKVICSSMAPAKVAMQACKVSCIACRKCEKACEYDAIHVNNNLAKVDPEKCTHCGACIEVCPKDCIIMQNC